MSSYYTAPQRDNERKKDAFTGSIPVLTTKINCVVLNLLVSLYSQKKIMRDFNKEYKEWKKEMWEILIVGVILGFIAGMLLT